MCVHDVRRKALLVGYSHHEGGWLFFSVLHDVSASG